MRKQELHPRTAVINKSQKNQSKKSRLEALQWLSENFPKAFDNTLHISPLKKGIMNDILIQADKAVEDGISKSKLREAVVLFTRRVDYLTCLKSREMRIDLEGKPVGEVSEEDAERAAAKIKKRVEKSARNARKNLVPKSTSHSGNTHAGGYSSYNSFTETPKKPAQSIEPGFPSYPPRSPAYASDTTSNQQAPAKSTSVIVKHKPTRQYDPDAVARLKAKLGLSRKEETNKESIE